MEGSEIIGPVLLVGVGGLGRKIVLEVIQDTRFDYIIISNNEGDIGNCNSLYIDCKPWVNPGVLRTRSFVKNYESEIYSLFSKYKTVVIISNLAGRTGASLSPVLARLAKSCAGKVISFVVMPFRFETERLFHSATCLRRINAISNTVFVLDNDSFIEINPHLSLAECFYLTNNAMINIIKLIPSVKVPGGEGVICLSDTKEQVIEKALRDTIAMLYSCSEPDALRKSFLYISNRNTCSVSSLNTVVEKLRRIRNIDKLGEVDVLTSDNFSGAVNLVAYVEGTTKFESYDPLTVIPSENCLDWEVPDSHPEIDLPLTNIE